MYSLSSLGSKTLLGRLLTRSGDQAWDFVVPLVLLKLLPGELRVAAIYYLLVRLAHVPANTWMAVSHVACPHVLTVSVPLW